MMDVMFYSEYASSSRLSVELTDPMITTSGSDSGEKIACSISTRFHLLDDLFSIYPRTILFRLSVYIDRRYRIIDCCKTDDSRQ
jgi:hypothetical protein